MIDAKRAAEIAAIPDEKIDTSDIPEVSADFFEKARLVAKVPGSQPGASQMKNVRTRLDELLIVHLGVTPEQIRDDARLMQDLGADSLDSIELVMALEEEFGIEINDDEADKAKTVIAAQRLVEDYLEKKHERTIASATG